MDWDVKWAEDTQKALRSIYKERSFLGWEFSENVTTEHDCYYLKVLRCLDPFDKDAELCKMLAADDRRGDDDETDIVSQINDAFREAANSKNILATNLPGYRRPAGEE